MGETKPAAPVWCGTARGLAPAPRWWLPTHLPTPPNRVFPRDGEVGPTGSSSVSPPVCLRASSLRTWQRQPEGFTGEARSPQHRRAACGFQTARRGAGLSAATSDNGRYASGVQDGQGRGEEGARPRSGPGACLTVSRCCPFLCPGPGSDHSPTCSQASGSFHRGLGAREGPPFLTSPGWGEGTGLRGVLHSPVSLLRAGPQARLGTRTTEGGALGQDMLLWEPAVPRAFPLPLPR